MLEKQRKKIPKPDGEESLAAQIAAWRNRRRFYCRHRLDFEQI